jgi:hypothetical protein
MFTAIYKIKSGERESQHIFLLYKIFKNESIL